MLLTLSNILDECMLFGVAPFAVIMMATEKYDGWHLGTNGTMYSTLHKCKTLNRVSQVGQALPEGVVLECRVYILCKVKTAGEQITTYISR